MPTQIERIRYNFRVFLAREFPFFSSFFVRQSREYDFATPSLFREPLRQDLGITFDGAIVNERMLILFLNFQSEECLEKVVLGRKHKIFFDIRRTASIYFYHKF